VKCFIVFLAIYMSRYVVRSCFVIREVCCAMMGVSILIKVVPPDWCSVQTYGRVVLL